MEVIFLECSLQKTGRLFFRRYNAYDQLYKANVTPLRELPAAQFEQQFILEVVM